MEYGAAVAAFHFKMQVISRSAGRSVCAAAAYRAAQKIHDVRTGETHDYTRKRGILHSAILAPARAPEWARESESLWNRVEAGERRKDAQLARENVIALPHELTLDQNREWLHAFVEEAYVKRGMVAQVNIHAPHRSGDARNIHAHILLSLRQCTRDGFKDKKTRTWNEKVTLNQWREQCAAHINQALERAGRSERVDHRSFADQGLDRMPTKHLGVDAMQMERRGKPTRIGDQNRAAKDFNRRITNFETALSRTEEAILEQELRARHQAQERDQETGAAKTVGQQGKERVPSPAPSLAGLDALRDREADEDRRRAELRRQLAETYKRQDAEKALKMAQEQLGTASGMFGKVSGRKRALEARVEALRANLENIRQREAETLANLEKDIQARRALDRQREEMKKAKPTPTLGREFGREASNEDLPSYSPAHLPTQAGGRDNEDGSELGR